LKADFFAGAFKILKNLKNAKLSFFFFFLVNVYLHFFSNLFVSGKPVVILVTFTQNY